MLSELPDLRARRALPSKGFVLQAVILLLAVTGGAADGPPSGSPYYMQTSGKDTVLGIGDWYTGTGTGGSGYHYFEIALPCPGNTTLPIHIDLFSPELHGGAPATIDELRDNADATTTAVAEASNTIFELYVAGTVVAPFGTPAPGAAGSLLQTTYAPVATAETWVRFHTIPVGSTCGKYILRAETSGGTPPLANDDNGWRIRVSGDNDASALTPPVGTGLDPGITIGQIYGTFQHSGGGSACIDTFELLAPGPATFHNFDMDGPSGGATSVTYFPPDGSAGIPGTVSNNAAWNLGGVARGGDNVMVGASQGGYWRITQCATPNNQFIQEGGTPQPGLFSLPLSMSLTKDDGVTAATPGGNLVYTITFTNTSVPTGAVASSVVIRDTIPANTTFDTASVQAPFTGTCSFSAGVVTCPINENVAPGGVGTVLVSVLVNSPAAGSTVVNNASLGFKDTAPIPVAYPTVLASDTDQLASLGLTKSSSNPLDTGDGPQVGDVITYTMTVTNPTATRQTGIVVNDPAPSGTTYVPNSTVATGFQIKTFRDNFNTDASYAGNNGTDNFAAAWQEIGEADGAGAGSERVLGTALRVGDADSGGGEGVARQANLLIAGGTLCAATLAFDFRQNGLDGSESVAVAISGSGPGGPFFLLETFNGGSPGVFAARSYNVTARIAANTVVRFLSNGSLEGGEYLEVDNVVLENKCQSVKDNLAGGANQDLTSGIPSTLVQATDNFDLDPGDSMTVSFQATVSVAGLIVNTATASSAENPSPAQATVRDVAVTRASLGGIRVSGGVVEFATTRQRATKGFNLYSADSRLRRGPRTRINAELIPSPRPESMTPVLYRVQAQVTGPFLWIEEVELGSESGRMMGPFPVDDEHLRRQFERQEVLLAGQVVDDRAGARTEGRAPKQRREPDRKPARHGTRRDGATGVKIEIARAGRVDVPWADLIASGLPSRLAGRGARLELSSEGVEVPLAIDSAGISFVARDLASDHTAQNVYVLTWSGRPGMKERLSRSEPRPRPGMTRIQTNWYYYGFAPRGSDPWLWDILISGEPWPASYAPTQGDFDLPGYTERPGGVAVRVSLVGVTAGNHAIEASINGAPVGRVTFEGATLATLEGTVQGSALRPSGNRLTLSYSTDGPETGFVFLNYMDLQLTLPPGVGTIARLSSFESSLPRLGRADYLIVTHADFEVQAERIADLKRDAGYEVAVVDVERAYDAFAAGIPDARAVHALIASAPRASMVLLVGDDTLDPGQNYMAGERVFIPSAWAWSDESGRMASENLFADRDDDGSPDLALGRLAVRTPKDADVAADKIAFGPELLARNRGRHTVIVDNQGADDIGFRGEGRRVEAQIGGATSFIDIAAGAGPARDDLMAALQTGAVTTSYFGHGAPDHWADEWVFGSDDAAPLSGSNQATFLLAWSCLSSDYLYLPGPSVSEAMQLVPMGGSVASFGPTGLSSPQLQREMYLRLYPKLMSGLPIGEAIRQAKAETLVANPSARDFLDGWVLLGDPALVLPKP